MEILKVQALNKQYQMGDVTVNALQSVDFTVLSGEFVAIMGPSGSGKSTLLHLMGGLDEPSAGVVSVGDHMLTKLDDRAVTLVRRRDIGFIFQFFNLVPTLTAEENIALPLLIDGKSAGSYQEKIDGLLAMVGLSDRRHHMPHQLSGGQQQRVAIARAFVADPDIVLADEPTGNLDSKTGEEILKLLRRSCDDLGQTIVMVTHDVAAASYADRVVFLRDGGIVDSLSLTADRSTDVREIQHRLREIEVS
jgi:putative ABC transport system ATP-binding protein